MKKSIIIGIMFVLASVSLVFAEASFEQIQELIKEQNYSAAVKGLEVIIVNHPKSSKAYYALAQSQAGMGNQVKAKEALDMATGLDPSLKFTSSNNVEKLKEAITPQTKKIEAIESHTIRNSLIVLILLGGIGYFIYRKKKNQDKPDRPISTYPTDESTVVSRMKTGMNVKADHVPDPVPHTPRITNYHSQPSARNTNYTSPAPTTTIINNHTDNSSGLVTGMVLGSILSSNNHHTDATTIIERDREYVPVREVVREVPAERETPSSSSSWNDDRGESKSSSWESSSNNSSSSSSWDSGSSSSSSWSDSGSSSDSSSSSWD